MFDRVDSRGITRLWTAGRDGRFERCLTCEIPQFRAAHTGAARWHPSGEFVVLMSERPFVQPDNRRDLPVSPFLGAPGRNRGSNIWILSVDGKRLWAVTGGGREVAGAVAAPIFSYEGDRLAWVEREASAAGSAWGQWAVNSGRFRFRRSAPHVSKVDRHRLPSKSFATTLTFTPDDGGVIVAGPPAQVPSGVEVQDVFSYDFESKSATPLTDTADSWEGHWAAAPSEPLAVFSSTFGLDRPPRVKRETTWFRPVSELWIGNPVTDTYAQLTRFNNPLSEHYAGVPVHVGPATWAPEGDALLVTVTPVSGNDVPSLYRIELTTTPEPATTP